MRSAGLPKRSAGLPMGSVGLLLRWGVGAAFALLFVGPSEGSGQTDPRQESRMLREAARNESAGDLVAAAGILITLLESHASSTGAIFALERVLRAQGRVVDVLPRVDAFLAADPASAAPRGLKLRVLLETDSIEALRSTAEDWIDADPTSRDPYREVARVYKRAFGGEEALAVLLRGQDAVGATGALGLETGDVLLELGRREEALAEWATAIDDGGAQVPAVLRRVAQIGRDRRSLVQSLVTTLSTDPTTSARKRAAVQISLEVGLEEDARRLSEQLSRELPESQREGFLSTVARLAEEKNARQLALWAYQAMRNDAPAGSGAQALDQQIAANSLTAGDTARALQAQERLAGGLPARSPERRRALATVVRLEAAVSAPAVVQGRLDAFQEEFPRAPETDALAAALSERFVAQGDVDAATLILDGVEGPNSALEWAYLHLDGDDPEVVRQDLATAAADLSSAQATDAIQLMGILDRVGEEAYKVAGRAALSAHHGDRADAVAILDVALYTLPIEDQPPLMAMAARFATEAGQDAEAMRLRETLIATFPDAQETPEATLDLARYRASAPAGVAQAIELLEELILAWPNSAVVPVARRELERLRSRGEAQ